MYYYRLLCAACDKVLCCLMTSFAIMTSFDVAIMCYYGFFDFGAFLPFAYAIR